MPIDTHDTCYDSEKPDKIVDDLFSGKMPIEQAIQKLRSKLLDLSTRNRLISYRFPKGKSIQFIDRPNLNLVYSRLIDGKSLYIKHIPDPPPDSYTNKKTDVKVHAQSLKYDTEPIFPPECCASSANRHTPKLQALYYPTDLDKLCRKIASEARTVIEETGTNMLYLIFGYLEFYDSESSEKPIYSPLLSVPVTIDKVGIDQETRTYQFAINYSGEDIQKNQTLREKLSQDFNLQMPDFNDEAELSNYFSEINQAVKNKRRWQVKHQLTLGFLSFGKLAIWDDLDPRKNSGLLTHPLLNKIFSGGTLGSSSLASEDYKIDAHPQGNLPIIYDADSSQHSAIIDVLDGKNIVINGPPGTGKSQTITNIIATGLKAGKKILFVSEKLAALEVVRHRLNNANLGQFCLELHSHKTQKKKMLSDIQDRLDATFISPQQLQNKISSLNRHKSDLNRYAELISSHIDNELDLTVYDIFWRTEKHRLAIGDLANNVQSLYLSGANKWSYDEIEGKRSKLEVLGQLFSIIGNYDKNHSWWGFLPRPLAPGDDDAIGRIIHEAYILAEALNNYVGEFQNQTNFVDEPSIRLLTTLESVVSDLQDPPENIIGELLPRVFCSNDPLGKLNKDILNGVISKVEYARELKSDSENVLNTDCQITIEVAEPIFSACSKFLNKASLTTPLNELSEMVSDADISLRHFKQLCSNGSYSYLPILLTTLENLNTKINAVEPLEVLDQSSRNIREGSQQLLHETSRLRQAYERVSEIAYRRELNFDGSPTSIMDLSRGEGIAEILPGVQVDEEVILKAKQAADYYLSGLSIGELDRLQHEMHDMSDRISKLLHEIDGYATKLGFSFDGTQKSIDFLVTASSISSKAPSDLLDFRHPALAHPISIELVTKAEDASSIELTQRQKLSSEFYLDVLPETGNLKSAILAFRRGDSLFNFFNSEWRTAKKLFTGISKTKLKYKAPEYEAKLTYLVNWIEHKTSIITNEEYKNAFGPLFRGLDTDFGKIRRLQAWYIESQAKLIEYPGFIDMFNLNTLNSQTVVQLGALSSRLEAIHHEFTACKSTNTQLLGEISSQMEAVLRHSGWNEFNKKLFEIAEAIKTSASFLKQFVKSDVSPKRSVNVLNAKMEIISAKDSFDSLNVGLQVIQDKIEYLLPGISKVRCDNWKPYLSQLSNIARSSASLDEFLSEFGGDLGTGTRIRAFFEAKLHLDECLSKFTETPDRHEITNWEMYGVNAAQRINAASELVSLLLPAGQKGKCIKTVIAGLTARQKSSNLISELKNDESTMSMLQNLFQGVDTDLVSLASTINWGEQVAIKNSIRGCSLYTYILDGSVQSNFKWSKAKLKEICESHLALNKKLSELNEYGTYSTEDWNQSGNELSSSVLNRIEIALKNVEAVLPWSKYIIERTGCQNTGLQKFVDYLEKRKIPHASIGAVFEFVIYRSIGRGIYKQFPELESFSGENHEKIRAEFVELDKEIIGLTGKSFAYEIDRNKRVPRGITSMRAAERTQMYLLHNELSKQRRHIPIRQLIRRAGLAIQELKPCFMMGPLSVAQYLQQGTVKFDIIVMDEASQLRPEESLGAIARGSQLIVVGDPKQLPPTNFFDRLVDDGEDDDNADSPAVFAGSESILDICQQLFNPVRTLKWHYRSQHESLIAFSNHHFYNGKLIVFPSPFDKNSRLGLRYRYIKNGTYKDRQNMQEAQRVVDAIIEHMIKFPKESLGVVTLNQTQRDLIEDLLDKKIRNIEEAQHYIAKWEEEGWSFFVKNLENVQGDERDIIYISTTFGKALGTDKVRQNFGPISRPDGWRRLNVLFTRARKKIELFTSMLPEDIIVEDKTPAGTKALKEYLDFAKRGILTHADLTGREADSDFEISVGDMLRNNGYDVVPQVGVAGFFIDLAVRNPEKPGEFLAAVECDGASYHSSSSARDRDRIRQEILESLGWKDRIWRIWSTDWFYNPRRESERLLDFLKGRRIISRSEPVDYEIEEELEDVEEEIIFPLVVDDVELTDLTLTASTEELFVEVGDLVTYCSVNSPEMIHTLMIVDSENNPSQNHINEHDPRAMALLNATVGDEVEIAANGSTSTFIRVLKVQR